MDINLLRINGTKDESTIGLLYVNKSFFCFTLEDEGRQIKVRGETRVPAGTYDIKLRTEGGMTKRYSNNYPDMHQGMVWLQNVPNFEWVYIHIGNKAENTDGCILVGETLQNNNVKDGFVGASGNAYKRLYPLITTALEKGEKVDITISDEDTFTSYIKTLATPSKGGKGKVKP